MRSLPTDIQPALAFAIPIVVLLIGINILVRNRRERRFRMSRPVVAVNLVYLAYTSFFLISLFGSWQLGAYLFLVAAVAFFLQAMLLCARPR